MAKEAGFDVSKADWLMYQSQQALELSDKELESVAGGIPVSTAMCHRDVEPTQNKC